MNRIAHCLSGPVLAAWAFWLLLTGDAGLDNLLIGLAGALLAGRIPVHRVSAFRMLATSLKVLAALPVSYAQAFWILLVPHRADRTEHQPGDDAPDPWRTFERVFLITLTPRSLAFGEDERGGVNVHRIARKESP